MKISQCGSNLTDQLYSHKQLNLKIKQTVSETDRSLIHEYFGETKHKVICWHQWKRGLDWERSLKLFTLCYENKCFLILLIFQICSLFFDWTQDQLFHIRTRCKKASQTKHTMKWWRPCVWKKCLRHDNHKNWIIILIINIVIYKCPIHNKA